MKQWKPPTKGEFKVRPGKRVIWLSRPSKISMVFAGVAILSILLGMVAIGVPVVPMVWYRVKPSAITNLAKVLRRPVVATESKEEIRTIDDWQPEKDSALPDGGWLKIPAIKVNTQIHEEVSEQYEEALKKGVWRIPEFGTPILRESPTILVAHRFGYLKWSNSYRRDNSFFNLPKLKVGDTIDIYWGQRHYIYEVYAGDEGTEISDYTADLILYTCQYIESDRRIFRYARLRRG